MKSNQSVAEVATNAATGVTYLAAEATAAAAVAVTVAKRSAVPSTSNWP